MGALYLRRGRAGTFWVEEEKVPRGGVWQALCLQAPDWRAKCLGGQAGGQSFRGLFWSSGGACDPRVGTSLLREDCVLKKLQGTSRDGKGARGKARPKAIGVHVRFPIKSVWREVAGVLSIEELEELNEHFIEANSSFC